MHTRISKRIFLRRSKRKSRSGRAPQNHLLKNKLIYENHFFLPFFFFFSFSTTLRGTRSPQSSLCQASTCIFLSSSFGLKSFASSITGKVAAEMPVKSRNLI